MLSIDGFRHHLSSIVDETRMYQHYKHEVSLQSVERSIQILLDNFLEQQKEIEKLKAFIENNEYDLTPEFRQSFPNGF